MWGGRRHLIVVDSFEFCLNMTNYFVANLFIRNIASGLFSIIHYSLIEVNLFFGLRRTRKDIFYYQNKIAS